MGAGVGGEKLLELVPSEAVGDDGKLELVLTALLTVLAMVGLAVVVMVGVEATAVAGVVAGVVLGSVESAMVVVVMVMMPASKSPIPGV